jgi:hypothetical protein
MKLILSACQSVQQENILTVQTYARPALINVFYVKPPLNALFVGRLNQAETKSGTIM